MGLFVGMSLLPPIEPSSFVAVIMSKYGVSHGFKAYFSYLCRMSATVVILILAIAFAATLFRSTFGFGEALIAVPLFSLFLPISTAVPLAVLMSILVAVVVLIQDHSKVHFASAKWLIIFALPGIPVGLALLFYGNDIVIKTILGVIIILYSIYAMTGKATIYLKSDNKLWLFVCGFLSGVFGGAYGVNGPPLVLYGNMRGWDAQYFRATLQAYFLPAGLISMIGYISKGMITETVMLDFVYSIPVIIPAIFLGRYLNSKMAGRNFYKYIYAGLMLIGILLIAGSFLF